MSVRNLVIKLICLTLILCLFLSIQIPIVSADGCIGCDDFPDTRKAATNTHPFVGVWDQGFITSDVDEDWIKVTLDIPSVFYELKVKPLSIKNLHFEVVDKNGKLLFSGDSPKTSFSYWNLKSGTILYLRIKGTNDESGNYKFRSLPWFSVYPIAAYAQEKGNAIYDVWGSEKTLLYVGGEVQGVGLSIYIDLADYTGVTTEGQNGWVTVWGVLKGAMSVQAFPDVIGLVELETGSLPEHGDKDISRGGLFSCDTPVFNLTLVDGDNSGDMTYYLGDPKSTGVSCSAISAEYTFTKFEIRRKVMDAILNDAFTAKYSLTIGDITQTIIVGVKEAYNKANKGVIRSATETD